MGKTSRRRQHMVVSVCLLLAMSLTANRAAHGAHGPEVPSPNIVMLMTDDETLASMRYLPHIRRLIADRGVTFTNSIVTTPLCCPSRSTYLTGQYAHNHGVLFNSGPDGGFAALRDQGTIFPVALQRAGYYTVHIGKYLNGYRPDLGIPPGWDQFNATYGARTYNYYGVRLDENGRTFRFNRSERNYSTRIFTRLAVRTIRERAGKGPFLLNVAFLAPHAAGTLDHTLRREPLQILADPKELDYRLAVPSLEDRRRFAHLALPRSPAFDEQTIAGKPAWLRDSSLFRPFTRRDIADIAARYHAQLASLLAVDDAVSQITHALAVTGQLQRTVIIFTSDNGFFNGEHRIRAGKYYVYEPSIRVPLLMRGPGIPAGVTRDEPVANIDLAPTILALAHATPLRPPDGISLVPIMQGTDSRRDRDLLIETGPNHVYPVTYRAVQTQQYVYVEYSSGDRELYDLRRDPNELVNLAGSSWTDGLRRELHQRLISLTNCRASACAGYQ